MAVDGTYNIEMNTPMGARPGTLTLKTDGDSLSGTFSGGQGEQSFQDGTVAGEEVAWSIQMSGPMGEMKLDFKGTVSGDDISGQVQLGSFGSATFKGTRA
jgi:hypothetical protein